MQVSKIKYPQAHNSLTIQIAKPTLIEVGLWLIFIIGPLLGALKRNPSIDESIVSLGYDALCFGLLAFVVMRRAIQWKSLPISTVILPILVFCGYSFITIFNTNVTTLARGILGWRFLSSAMLLHLLGYYAFTDGTQIRRLLIVFWITGTLVAAYGIVQLVRGYTPTELAWISELAATMKIANTGRYRLMSSMGSAVDLGFFLSMAIPSLFGVFTNRKRRSTLHLIMLGVMITTLLFTYVRAAWVATYVSCMFLLGMKLWSKKIIRRLFPIMLVLGVFLIIVLPAIASNFANRFENPALRERIGSLAKPLEDPSMLNRFETWGNVASVINKYPMGIGVGMAGAASLKFPSETSPAPVTIDNSYLEIIIETGWIGLVFFLWLIQTTVWGGMRIANKAGGDFQIVAYTIVACTLSYVVILLFGEYIEFNPGRSLIWILTGILFSLPRLTKHNPAYRTDDLFAH